MQCVAYHGWLHHWVGYTVNSCNQKIPNRKSTKTAKQQNNQTTKQYEPKPTRTNQQTRLFVAMNQLDLMQHYDSLLKTNQQKMLHFARSTGRVQACRDLLEVMRDMVLNNCDVFGQTSQLVGLLGWQAKHLVDQHISMLQDMRKLFVQLGCLGC